MNRPRILPPAVVTAIAAALLALHWWMAVTATTRINATTDELAHVTGGLSYWKFDDYRLQPENGNLPQRLAGLPWLAAGAEMTTADTNAWGNSNVWLVGHRLFYASGNETDYLLLLSRGTMALVGVALGLVIFLWSRRLWGDAGGLFSLALYAFCPNFLAHAPLATSDVAMTLCLVGACGAYWNHTRRLSWRSAAASIALVSAAVVTKFSFVLLIPIFGLMIMIRLAAAEPLVVVAPGGRETTHTGWKPKLGVLLASSAVHALVAWVVIWACFGFRFTAVGPGMPGQKEFFASWTLIMTEFSREAHPFWYFFFTFTRGYHVLPEAFLQGFGYVLYAAAARGAFLNGDFSITGWPEFFPYAFLVKSPPAQLFAFVLAAIGALRFGQLVGSRAFIAKLYVVTPLVLLFAVYWAFSVTSHLNIGHRHILPTYPTLFIAAGLLCRPGPALARYGLAGALAIWAAADSVVIRPHYIAYFNGIAGGPANGWRHLVDSSLDWGQDLPSLKVWLDQNSKPGEPVYVSYAGSGDLEYEGIRASELAPVYNFDRPRRWFELKPGLYAIGATMLQDTYSQVRGPWSIEKEAAYLILRGKPAKSVTEFYDLDRLRFARLCHYLRVRKPDGMIGYSILAYRLTDEELRVVTTGSISDLATLMDKAVGQ